MYRQLETGNKLQVKYIEEGGVLENGTDMGEVDRSGVEESDHFEDCE